MGLSLKGRKALAESERPSKLPQLEECEDESEMKAHQWKGSGREFEEGREEGEED